MQNSKIKILDCTLRDGGYINNWEFGKGFIKKVLKNLHESKIELIECGYIKDSVKLNPDSVLFPNVEAVSSFLRSFSFSNKNISFYTMINFGDVDIKKLAKKTSDNLCEGIRLAFHKKDLNKIEDYALALKEKGYKVFIQPMNTKVYSGDELTYLFNMCNKIKPFALYYVDSFGNSQISDVESFLCKATNSLNNKITLGIHCHNNLQLALSNSLFFIQKINSAFNIIIDSSLYGMGRGAGNLYTEVITNYLNKNYSKDYDTDILTETIDSYVTPLKKNFDWGYSIPYMLCAKNECHPNYAKFLIDKKTLNTKSISEILSSLDYSKKNNFDSNYIKDHYFKYNSRKNNTSKKQLEIDVNKNVYIIASGQSVNENATIVKQNIQNNNGFTIAINHIPSWITPDYIFISNQKRLDRIAHLLDSYNLILTSNLKYNSNAYYYDYKNLLKNTNNTSDNATILAISLTHLMGFKKLFITGLDGYCVNSNHNYCHEELNIINDKATLIKKNIEIESAIKYFVSKTKLYFITPSIFEKYSSYKILGVIPARFKSTRFPGKPLALIDGIPMIKRTYSQALLSKELDKVIIATDSNEISDYCKSENIPYIYTSSEHLTGTDRIAEVASKFNYDLYVNIQGDEPVISPFAIDELCNSFKLNKNKYSIFNMFKNIENELESQSNTIIKVAVNKFNELMYMSRHAIPYSKDSHINKSYFKQVCIYGFTADVLKDFSNSKKTYNESFEDIEILRFLELGYKVKMIETKHESISVDVKSDIKKVEQYLINI